MIANLVREADSTHQVWRTIFCEDVAPAQPPGPVQRNASGIFESPAAQKLLYPERVSAVLSDPAIAVVIVQGALGAGVLTDTLSNLGARVEHVPQALLQHYNLNLNQINFQSAGATNQTKGALCVQAPGAPPKLVFVQESSGWALSHYNSHRACSLACFIGQVNVGRRVFGANSLPNDDLLRFLAQGVKGGLSKELTEAANRQFDLRGDSRFVSAAVRTGALGGNIYLRMYVYLYAACMSVCTFDILYIYIRAMYAGTESMKRHQAAKPSAEGEAAGHETRHQEISSNGGEYKPTTYIHELLLILRA